MDNIPLKEWEVCRDAVKAFDERLHDIRKYGFTFLTALLTADSILIPTALAESMGKVAIPGLVKFSVLAVTLLLIVAISLIERNYQLFIKAIVQRALVLERTLNIELSEIITIRYREGYVRTYRDGLYVAFAAAVLVLGYAILSPDQLLVNALAVCCVAVMVFTTLVMRLLELQYKHVKFLDWSLDRNECQQGESVAITITNLSPTENQTLDAGTLLVIESLDGTAVFSPRLDTPIIITPENNHTCIWDTSKAAPGTYRVFPQNWRHDVSQQKWLQKVSPPIWQRVALRRKITVTKKKPTPQTT